MQLASLCRELIFSNCFQWGVEGRRVGALLRAAVLFGLTKSWKLLSCSWSCVGYWSGKVRSHIPGLKDLQQVVWLLKIWRTWPLKTFFAFIMIFQGNLFLIKRIICTHYFYKWANKRLKKKIKTIFQCINLGRSWLKFLSSFYFLSRSFEKISYIQIDMLFFLTKYQKT